MAARKALRTFMVRVRVAAGTPREQLLSVRPIQGTAFFFARASYAAETGVEPGDIVLAEPRRYT